MSSAPSGQVPSSAAILAALSVVHPLLLPLPWGLVKDAGRLGVSELTGTHKRSCPGCCCWWLVAVQLHRLHPKVAAFLNMRWWAGHHSQGSEAGEHPAHKAQADKAGRLWAVHRCHAGAPCHEGWHPGLHGSRGAPSCCCLTLGGPQTADMCTAALHHPVGQGHG